MVRGLAVQAVCVAAVGMGLAVGASAAEPPGPTVGPERTGGIPSHDFPLTYRCTGSETSQGDALIGADVARSTFGVTGAGVKVGILSDSFDALGGYAGGIASGDLPGTGNPTYPTPVNVLQDDSGTDEGRALAEIVHDVAPGAELLFHSVFNAGTRAGFAAAVDNLVAAGANVIIDDVGYVNEPYFQDGVIAQALDNARAAGVACFTSAGNQGTESYAGPYNHTLWNPDTGWTGHDFDANGSEGGDSALNVRVGAGGTMRAVLQWTDPYPSVGAPVGHQLLDLDLYLYDFGAGAYVDGSIRDQTAGDDPWELVGAANTATVSNQYGLVVDYWDGPTDRDLKIVVYNGEVLDDDDTDSPTVVGHSAAEGTAAVAAMWVQETDDVESYSSRGPTDIRFDTDGDPAPEVRDSLLITAHDGVDTTFLGFDTDGDGTPEFFGTSASSPHAAAVAALMLERAADLGVALTPEQIMAILADTATDIETAGYDHLSGHGLIDAYAAVDGVPEPASVLLLAAGAGLVALRRRRRG